MKYLCLSVLCFCLLGAGPVKAMPAAAPGTSAALRRQDAIRLPETARCGEGVLLTVSLPKGPEGAFPSVGLDWLERPAGKAPDVLTGVPETDIVFHVPGQYRCRVRTGYMIKGS